MSQERKFKLTACDLCGNPQHKEWASMCLLIRNKDICLCKDCYKKLDSPVWTGHFEVTCKNEKEILSQIYERVQKEIEDLQEFQQYLL